MIRRAVFDVNFSQDGIGVWWMTWDHPGFHIMDRFLLPGFVHDHIAKTIVAEFK
jgi:hypothetical protein